MKALIISDSHGRANDVMDAVEKVKPDVLFHLGDGAKDLRGMGLLYPDVTVYQVGGNCDYSSNMELVRQVNLQGIRILMTHGHIFNVKQSIEKLIREAKGRDVNVVMFGHTHVSYYEERDGLMIINPGSIGYSGKYGVLTIENGKLSFEKEIL